MTKIWKYNNLLLKEKKDHIIRKLQNIEQDDRDFLIKIFNENPQYENQIDWNKRNSLTIKDFEKVIKDYESKQARINLLGTGARNLKEGKDYIFLGSGEFKGESWIAVQPLMYYSSRVLASSEVGPSIDARWCLAWQKERIFWDWHCIKRKEAMIFLMGESIPSKKVCITPTLEEVDSDADGVKYRYTYKGIKYNIWDSNDKWSIYPDDLPQEFFDFIEPSLKNMSLVEKYHDEDVKKTNDIEYYEEFKKFIKKLTFNPETKRYDYDGDVNIHSVRYNPYIIKDGKLQIKFGVVEGDFDINECESLTSLEGSPEYVGRGFFCNDCTNLTTLKGAPIEVCGSFDCSDCTSLTSLEGAPTKVCGSFDCSDCTSLTSLEGAPIKVGGDFICYECKSLTSLEGAPDYVGESFNCSSCRSLTSLEGAPTKVGGSFTCEGCCYFTTLKGAPEYVEWDFDCSFCASLTSLEGCPNQVGGIFKCTYCSSLTSLKGAPREVGRDFNCSYCSSLTTLDGCPNIIGGDFKWSNYTHHINFSALKNCTIGGKKYL